MWGGCSFVRWPRLGLRRRATSPNTVTARTTQQRKGGVTVSYEQPRIGRDTQRPTVYADHEIEKATRVTAGDDDREPRDHNAQPGCDAQDGQNDVVGNGENPLDQRQPMIQVAWRVGVVQIEVDCLLLVGRGVLISQEHGVCPHPGRESCDFEVPVEPPPWILAAEQQH